MHPIQEENKKKRELSYDHENWILPNLLYSKARLLSRYFIENDL